MPDTRFPILQPGATIRDAYGLMRESRRSAVIVPQADMFRIVTASDLVKRQSRRRDSLESLVTVRMAISIDDLKAGKIDLSPTTLRSNLGPDVLRRSLAPTGLHFAVADLATEDAWLVSPDADLVGALFIAPATCYCAHPVHLHKYEHGRHGTQCDFDSYMIQCW